MNVEVTKLPESRVKLQVQLTPEEVDQALDRAYRQLVQRVNIPGFRKGKAPRQVVERAVGHDLFLHEATDEAVRWGYRKAIDETGVTPIDEAEIDPGEEGHDHLHPAEPFQFEATVAVKPEVQLPDYHHIQVPRQEVEVAEADVDGFLRELQERSATLEPVTRPAQIGDVVTMNVVAKVDGEEVVNRENLDFELRDEQETADELFPGLSQELVGATPGQIQEVALHLPDLYADQELAGKTMFLRVLVKEFKRKVLPELDDEFAQTVSQYETLPELRDAVRENLTLERRMEADEQLVNDTLEAVVSRSFVDIPPVLIEEELDRIVSDMRRALEARQLSFDAYLEIADRSEQDIRNDAREDAVKNVKTALVLGAIGDAEDIQVSNREVDAALEELVRSMRTTQAERRRLRSSTGVRSNIRSRVRRQRTIQKLVEIVTGGDAVAPEAAEAVADQTAATAEDTEETVAVEIGG